MCIQKKKPKVVFLLFGLLFILLSLLASHRGLEATSNNLMLLGSISNRTRVNCSPTDISAGKIPANAKCFEATVIECSYGVPDFRVEYAITNPPIMPVGTIVFFSGGGGGGWFTFKDQFDIPRSDRFQEYFDHGYRVVQVRFPDGGWQEADGAGFKAAACRPATIIQNLSTAWDQAFCVQGFSGGTSAIAYTMTHYGGDQYVDHVVLVHGSPYAEVDKGCAPQDFPTPDIVICDGQEAQIVNPSYTYFKESQRISVDAAHITPEQCHAAFPGQANPDALNIWHENSLISADMDTDWETTKLDQFFCNEGGQTNVTAGQGDLFYEEIISDKSQQCFMGHTQPGGICYGEKVWEDPAGFAAIKQSMFDNCQ